MPSTALTVLGPKMTEAAQVNLGGLECSAYAWQVRHMQNVRLRSDCQGNSDPATRRPPLRTQHNVFYFNVLNLNSVSFDNRHPPKNGSE